MTLLPLSACHHLQRSGSTLHPRPDLLFLMTMPGWRRNLTFCLQRMHQEGRKPKQNERACACPCVLGCRRCGEQFVCGDTLRFPLHVFRVFWITGSARAHVLRGLNEEHLQLRQLCCYVRARADTLSCAHTCQPGFVPPFQQLLRDVTDAGRSGRVCVWLHE